MSESKELKKIKRIYGEKFARMCREMFPTILEEEGALLDILERTFSHNCNSLYEAIVENGQEEEFKNLVYREFNLPYEENEESYEGEKVRTPYEILEENGYDLFECKNEDDIQLFEKYYAKNEVICTIYNGGRLEKRECFFAVKKNIDGIRRENFKKPNKSDEYSTSVLGIQFTRNNRCTVEIISRYNHTVSNPNCTLNNDLDKLAPGLKKSFVRLLKERGLELDTRPMYDLEIPGYTVANDGKYYKYNMEINGEYYCPGNIIISNGEVINVGEPEKGILMDYFYLNFQEKKIYMPRHLPQSDSFVDAFEDIRKIEVKKGDLEKVVKVYVEGGESPILITLDKDNQIVGYQNKVVERVGDKFLLHNRKLKELCMTNLKQVGDNFLHANKELKTLDLPNLVCVGKSFFYFNKKVENVSLPNLTEVESQFLFCNLSLRKLDLPKLVSVAESFLPNNKLLEALDLPELRETDEKFLYSNESLEALDLPKLEKAGNHFLCNNKRIRKLVLPRLNKVENSFLYRNEGLTEISLPELKQAGNYFLHNNLILNMLSLDKLEWVGESFLSRNQGLKSIRLPKLQHIEYGFLLRNVSLSEVEIPKNLGVQRKLREEAEKNRNALVEKIKSKQEKIKEQEEEYASLVEKATNSRESRDSYHIEGWE